MKKYWLYIHTCPNGKKYVGVTTASKPEFRWKEGRGYEHQLFGRAILKYGWDNITHEVFEVDSAEEMYRKEVELISFYHSNDPEYGYNCSTGGEKSALGYRHSEEMRKKMSEARKGKPLSKEHKRHMAEAAKKRAKDPEYRKKLSEARKGKTLKPFSEEHKRHIAEAKKGTHPSEEARKHMSEAQKNRPKPKVKIKLPDGTIVETTKNVIVRWYVNKGKKFEYVS